MKQQAILTVVVFSLASIFSCSKVEEAVPELSEKELVNVSIRSLGIVQAEATNGKTTAIPASVEYIDVIYGSYPETISDDHGQPSNRVIKSFAKADFPDNFTIELEKGEQYYIGIAAYSLGGPNYNSIYEIYSMVSYTQPIFTHGLGLKEDLFAFSKIFTAVDGVNIDAELNRISIQLKTKLTEGTSLPVNAKKVQLNVRDTSLDYVGAIDFNLLDPGDISDDITTYFEADLTSGEGINSVYHMLPLSDSAPLGDTHPLEIAVKLLDEFDNVIAEGSTELDIMSSNKCYNFILNPNAADQSISIDVDETIEEVVDVALD